MVFVKTNLENSKIIQYPYSLHDLYIDYPQLIGVIIDETVVGPLGIHIVAVDEDPGYYHLTHEIVVDKEPKKIRDGWVLHKSIRSRSPDEIQNYLISIQDSFVNAIQKRLDRFANTRNYDGILSACSYNTSNITKFKLEATYCILLRDATWLKMYEIMDQVNLGLRDLPASIADIESELPMMEWPPEWQTF